MTEKLKRASEYRDAGAGTVARAACLYLATVLGDLRDEVVLVGGIVPSLLAPESSLPEGEAAHAGTLDLDVGLSLAIFDNEKYRDVTARLRGAGFAPDRSASGNPTRQRWTVTGELGTVTVDFLIAPSSTADTPGSLCQIEPDFAAFIVDGLQLAFADRVEVPLEGLTILGETSQRSVWVCGPAAFVVLKALAFEGRGEPKDAYDLYYVLRNYGDGPASIARRLDGPMRNDAVVRRAAKVLRLSFGASNNEGPIRVSRFLTGIVDASVAADVVSYVLEFVDELRLDSSS